MSGEGFDDFACGLALGATLALAIRAWVVDVREYRSRDEH
jgi:hypothetical protein